MRFSSSGSCFSSCDRLFCSSFLASNIPLQALISSPCKALTSSDKARLSVSDTGRQELLAGRVFRQAVLIRTGPEGRLYAVENLP